jgi:ketosteroid isomerase-like protein
VKLPVATETRAELERLYAEWFAAIPRHDDDFFGRVLADDWVYTNIAGEVRGKLEYLDYIKQVPHDAPPNELLAFEVRLFGDIAIVHGDYAVASAVAGAPHLGSRTRFTAVWIRRGGHWQALTHHGCTIAEQQ